MKAIYFLWRLLKNYREKRQYLHMVLIDLEKVYNRVPKEVLGC